MPRKPKIVEKYIVLVGKTKSGKFLSHETYKLDDLKDEVHDMKFDITFNFSSYLKAVFLWWKFKKDLKSDMYVGSKKLLQELIDTASDIIDNDVKKNGKNNK